jgi:acyl-coenzyme A synthetase/AMP-(fatty) acid ligase
MKGYWEMPEETDQVLRDAHLPWPEKVLYTGDLFTSDDEGYLYWVSRKDDIIKTRGEKVSPKHVEDVLHALPGVAEAAVFGVPDEVLGSAIKALISLKPDAALTKQGILSHCQERLEDFMVPKYVELVPAIPRTENGKISRRALAAGLGGAD